MKRTTETSAEWRVRLMRETEGMMKSGDVLAHLAADVKKNGPPTELDGFICEEGAT